MDLTEIFFSQYETRDGSDKDRDKLERTFTGMGFDVKITENASKAEIFKLFEKLNNNFDVKTYDCLVVCILSHGDEREYIYPPLVFKYPTYSGVLFIRKIRIA